MTKQKTIKAWGIINKRGKMVTTEDLRYWIYETKKEAEFYLYKGEKVVKVEIKLT